MLCLNFYTSWGNVFLFESKGRQTTKRDNISMLLKGLLTFLDSKVSLMTFF